MDITLKNPSVKRNITAAESKSEAHRALICAAISDGVTKIRCLKTNDDIMATVSCLNSFGACITYSDGYFTVTPISRVPQGVEADCGESGSTLRFLLPLAAALGINASFTLHGRLPRRPVSELKDALNNGGADVAGYNPVTVGGALTRGEFTIDGSVSSQYISGLLFALTVIGGSLKVTGKTESASYINLTADILRRFGAFFERHDNMFYAENSFPLMSPGEFLTGGDWSNAAFFITAGIIGKRPVSIAGLDSGSAQGDRAVIDILRSLGAVIENSGGVLTSFPSALHAVDIDASDIPDLVPVLCVAAANASGDTRIYNAGRLRLKESDRLESTAAMINGLGGNAEITPDGLIIHGGKLTGGTVSSFSDHRIAMSAATAAVGIENEVTIQGFEAVNKSYPAFREEFERLI